MVAVILGSSGSGKSSALFAGLLPRLRSEQNWQIAQLRPGGQPFYALADALLPLLEPGSSETDRLSETRKLTKGFEAGEIDLFQVVERLLAKTPGSDQILLIIDQFEELYTLCPDKALQRSFIDTLLQAVAAASIQRRSPLVLLLTMRADFMGQALAHRPFADMLQKTSLLMGPMTREELHEAVEKPAELQGAAFEPGLVERILDDVGNQPGNLPLLQFALTLLWEEQDDGWLTHADYETIGCVDGALARYADEVFNRLDEAEQAQARRIFVQLVKPGEGTEDTRRVASQEELGSEQWRLVQHLADKRLVVTGRDSLSGIDTVEVVHEALIQRWGKLQGWMQEDRAFRAWQERLRGSLRQWQESGRDEGALLGGAPLAVAQSWLAERSGELSPPEAEYIQASQAQQVQRQKERERRRQWTVLALAAGLVLVAALGLVALFASQRASRSAQTAQNEANTRATAESVAVQERQNAQRQTAVLLAGQAETELANGYGDRAVLLALAALEDYPYTPQAEHALGQAVSYNRAVQIYSGHSSAVTSVAWSPDGTRVASSTSSDNNVHIWDPVTGKTTLVIDMPKGITGNKFDMALYVQWTPDGKRLLTLTGDRYTLGSQDYDLLVWDAASGELISSVEIANQAEPVSGELSGTAVNYPTGAAAEIAAHSGRLATLGGDNSALIWDAAWQKPALVLNGHTKGVSSVDWSPDETRLVTASLDGTAMIWDAQTGQTLHTLAGHEGRVNLALWSPDGSQIATVGADGVVRLWNAADGVLISSIATNAGEIFSLAWAPNGVRIFTGHGDGSLCIWEAASGKLLEILRGHQGIVSDLKWSTVDDRLASGDGSGYARIWNAAPSTAWRLYPPQAARGGDWTVQGADWSSDGRYLVLAGGDIFGDITEPPSFEIWVVQENKLMMENLGDALNFMGWDWKPTSRQMTRRSCIWVFRHSRISPGWPALMSSMPGAARSSAPLRRAARI
jgi:WD40 repeat protein